MKKISLLVCMIILTHTVMAQKNIPAIVVVDGMLPESVDFKCVASSGDTLSFTYFRSYFQMDNPTSLKLDNFQDTASLKTSMIYTEWYDGPPYKKMYEFECVLWKKVLMSGNVLISVTTFDRNKTIYYVDYSGGGWVKVYEYDKSYGNRKKAFRRVHSIYPKRHTNKRNVIVYSR